MAVNKELVAAVTKELQKELKGMRTTVQNEVGKTGEVLREEIKKLKKLLYTALAAIIVMGSMALGLNPTDVLNITEDATGVEFEQSTNE